MFLVFGIDPLSKGYRLYLTKATARWETRKLMDHGVENLFQVYHGDSYHTRLHFRLCGGIHSPNVNLYGMIGRPGHVGM